MSDDTQTMIDGRAQRSRRRVRRGGLSARLRGRRVSPAEAPSRRLPRVVYVLAAGTFLMGTTEFMIAGLLPDIADGLHVSEARAGLLITAFAVGMIVGSPVMALATAGFRRTPC